MAISNIVKRVRHAGSGTSYAITFIFYDSDEVKVIRTDANGNDTVLTETTDYSISGGSGSTGTCTTVTSYSDGYITLIHNHGLTQETDYAETSNFSVETLETDLDKIILKIQELKEQADRAIAATIGTDMTTFDGKVLPVASKLIGFNSTGTGITTYNAADVADATIVTLAGIQTLENKTLTSPTANTPTITSPTITGTITSTATWSGVPTFDNGFKTDTISEETATAGVTVDGFGIKDNAPNPTSWPSFSATMDGNQAVASTAATKVAFNTEDFDTNSDFDAATNFRFTPTVAGKYLVCMHVRVTSMDAGNIKASIYKNGAVHTEAIDDSGHATRTLNLSVIISMNGTTDYLEIYADSETDSAYTVAGGATLSRFGASRIA